MKHELARESRGLGMSWVAMAVITASPTFVTRAMALGQGQVAPRVFGRGDVVVVDLKTLPLKPPDERWDTLVAPDSRRASVGGAAGALEMVMWPAGGVIPPQAAELFWNGLLLEGTLIVSTSEDVPPWEMTAPSFLLIPAGTAYSIRCSARTDCSLLTFQAGPHNRRTPATLPRGNVADPDGLPAYFHDFGDVAWTEVAQGVWRGVFENAHWARLSVGSDDASLWRVARGAHVDRCVGKASDERVGVVLKGTLKLRSGISTLTAAEMSFYAVPKVDMCTCIGPVDCVVLAH